MNILWLSHLVPFPPKGGVRQRSYNLMREIAKSNNLYIVCFVQKAQHPTDELRREAIEGISRLGKVVADFSYKSDKSRINKMFLGLHSVFTRDPYTVNWQKDSNVGAVIRNTVERYNIDLVHFDTIGWAVYLDYVDGCKRVLNHHNIESHMMLRRSRKEKSIIKKLYYYQEGAKLGSYEKKVCEQFDLNITCSSTDTQRLRKFLPGLICEEIPNGVDLEYFRPKGLEQKPNSMIFVGGLSWYPNVAAVKFIIDEVWPNLIDDVDNVTMTLVGKKPPDWILDFSKKNEKFNVTGFVDDVRPYMEKAAVYVCPISDGGGTKLKILDALAMGKAIVAHPVACEGIDVEDGVSVVFASTPDEYVEKIKLLFSDEQLRKRIGSNGRKLIENKYNFIDIGMKLNRLYNSL